MHAKTCKCNYKVMLLSNSQLGRIQSYTTEDACNTLVCSVVTSRLDNDNAFCYGVNTQHNLEVQNTAARLITRSKKHDHITPVMSLHWLPMQYRIQCKLLLYTFKALHGQAPIYLKEPVSFYQP